MEYRSSKEIREMFLRFFESKGHDIKESASLIPHNDDTLLWINSGVAALKKYFDGSVKPENPRIANIQKSIRTNDIENVGKTARHHTFFEMMGNFSVGDYFKKDAIAFAYEFLFSKEWIGFDLDKAYVSVHPGDTEAYRIWTEDFNFPKERILQTEDNFWQIGNGPCGPNTEIFIDRGEAYDPEGLGEQLFFEDLENDRYIEVWNIVFSQFDGVEGEPIDTFKELPQKNIDTGMGFERLVSLVQNAETNFDTDLFMPIIHATETKSISRYQENPMAFRVIADHIRSVTFAISDGASFANEGRGYVLRRLLRRAARFGRQIGIEGLFFADLVDVVVEEMGEFYPNLIERKDLIKKLIHIEEERFAKTLEDGEKLLDKVMKEAKNQEIDGQTAFKLYDTYGFPYELSEEIAKEKGFSIDRKGFDEEMAKQRERARKARQNHQSMQSQNEALLDFKKESKFIYDAFEVEATVIAIVEDKELVEKTDDEAMVIFDQTVFYAESGGQAADTGEIVGYGEVLGVQKAPHGQHLHQVKLNQTLQVGQKVHLRIHREKRLLSMRNHSSIHLLNALLRKKLGEHVEQAGSYLDDSYFRFDFSHYESLGNDTLKELEKEMNELIARAIEVETIETDLKTAESMGALAFFEDRYGDTVRVVKMGDVSAELCGGTHVKNTEDIGVVKLIREESVGSGVRRIVGTSSLNAVKHYESYLQEQASLRQTLGLPVQKTLSDGVLDMQKELEMLKSQNASLQDKLAHIEASTHLNDVKETETGLKVLWLEVKDYDKDALSALHDDLAQKVDLLFMVNVKENGGQVMVSSSEKAQAEKHHAGNWVREIAKKLGAGGGGRPNFAQGGARDFSKLSEVKESVFEKIF